MIDLKKFRANPEIYIKATKDKQFSIDFDLFQTLDKEVLQLKTKLEWLLAERNSLTKEFEVAKKANQNADDILNKVKSLKGDIETVQKQYDEKYAQFNDLYLRIPNLVLEDVPFGESDEKNVEIEQIGEKPTFSFKPKSHWEILEARNMLDSERATKMSGSRFVIIRDGLAMLEIALIQYALQKLYSKGWSPAIVPTMVRRDALLNTGFVPYGEDQIYKISGDEENTTLYLVGTSEVPLVAQHSDETFTADQLPKRYVGYSQCYRSEAGTYGKDARGLIRLHQFEKVEMVSFCKPEDSEKELQLILSIEEEVYKELGIPYRKLFICTGDLGVPAAKKYDLEAWFPGQDSYKEITSCSNCTDFQTRRASIKYKTDEGREFVHSLNGTVVASSRVLAAIVENYQQADGSIKVPAVLQKYVGSETL